METSIEYKNLPTKEELRRLAQMTNKSFSLVTGHTPQETTDDDNISDLKMALCVKEILALTTKYDNVSNAHIESRILTCIQMLLTPFNSEKQKLMLFALLAYSEELKKQCDQMSKFDDDIHKIFG